MKGNTKIETKTQGNLFGEDIRDTSPQSPVSSLQSPPLITSNSSLITIYCDGACAGNPGPGGWGYIIEQNGQKQEGSGGRANTTNNQMELQALIEALKVVPVGTRVKVVTDSEYVCKGITSWMNGWIKNGWKTASRQPVKNRELWQELHSLLQQRPHRMEWVRGHAGHPENERCDELARAAIKRITMKSGASS